MLDIFTSIQTLAFLAVCMLIFSYSQSVLIKSDSSKRRIAIVGIGFGHIVLTLSFAAYGLSVLYRALLPQLKPVSTFIQTYGALPTFLFSLQMLFGIIFVAGIFYLIFSAFGKFGK